MQWLKSGKGMVTLFLLVLALLFAVQNMAIVQVQFLFWSMSMPQALLVVLLLLVGFLLGWIVSSIFGHRHERM